ncbi:MAG: pseudouridine synthase [Eubacteriales bacterium]|jgi:16S rRNA pseudouridine516 synthase|nr:16S rRNA pseudouridine(516) synthase [Oscillospiraceae bacterium]MDO5458741.1 16S rRNA pseudouridine(516) synthase [Eubacteriales bacterium]MBQ1579255.1 16S rRNA pseudouridine(516) synthase [Oscillospiraceae bacterium]MBQ2071729.1 16S rRNA pseudouridine(516) synthase [Oscillospiraceae bacterium]MBQ5428696.1 16S rRNA pseudouridine(516) synthase [Oscillospiraceae bacterium]
MRLDRLVSEGSALTRSQAAKAIRGGTVTVNGVPVCRPEQRVDENTDRICLGGKPVCYQRFHYYLMDKPLGLITASRDREAGTVLDLLPAEVKKQGVFPVGRLDKDTSGLLLLTDDGDFAHRVISPGSHVNKIYLAEVEGTLLPETVLRFREGIVLKDGTECLPAKLEILRERTCLVTVQEGKYHQVRRMLAAAGNPVVTLRRLQIGALRLADNSEPGTWRQLSEEEKAKVFL